MTLSGGWTAKAYVLTFLRSKLALEAFRMSLIALENNPSQWRATMTSYDGAYFDMALLAWTTTIPRLLVRSPLHIAPDGIRGARRFNAKGRFDRLIFLSTLGVTEKGSKVA